MENYHKHSYYTNTLVGDCATSYEAYLKRNLELGNHVISSVEHGFQSNYYVPYELVTNHNEIIKKRLENGEITKAEYERQKQKFIFGAEAYWVKDRIKEYPTGIDKKTGEQKYAKDRTNCHIIILAKNEEGRCDINEALSDANISGYYFQPRLDLELLLKIKPENVMVTTACLKYWIYEDIEEITEKLHQHFKSNFYLEVQYHNTKKQKEINRRILDISKKYGIDIICGMDSHYIFPEDQTERDNYLEGRGIIYDSDEIGWYMDYPSDAEVIRRFREQGVLSDTEIDKSIKNTNILLDFDDLFFDKEIKLPSIYPSASQEWKNKKLSEEVWSAWDKEKNNVQPSRYEEYEAGIKYELSAILNTGMADYFLLDKAIVERGIAKGGIVTKSGRGSGVSYYLNSLLGFSNIDRFISPVRLYPDRFLSETRILKTRSLPDLDLNLGNPEVFAEAQDEILTEAYQSAGHSYPMISYKPLQKSSAFKLYSKSQGLDFEIANEVTAQIKRYEKALKHADTPEEKENINIYSFVDKAYHKYLDESKKYQGIINAKSQAPCGYLVYSGDIKREIGLIKCKSESTHKEVITTVIDGAVAENYKFVKNDLLKVDIWLTINKIFERVGIKTPSVTEMTKLVENDKATWDIYANGCTMGINQCESDFGRQCCIRYKPQNMQELTALVAALRPGFKTQLENFLERKPYSSGIKALDDLLVDSFCYILYQENIMTYLGWLGIDQTETYDIIKKISKKKFKDKELQELKSRLKNKWLENTGSEDGFEESFKVVEAFALYAFNASHAYSYAYDSVYGAYTKAHYPYIFYSTMLQFLSEKGDKDKVALYKAEMSNFFGIKEGEYKFRSDNREFVPDEKNKCIYPAFESLKGFSRTTSDNMYLLKDSQASSFIDLLIEIKLNAALDKTQLDSLIKIGYFSEFGSIGKLLCLTEIFNDIYDKTKKCFKKQMSKAKIVDTNLTDEAVKAFCHKETDKTYMQVNFYGMIKDIEANVPFKDISDFEKASYQQTILKRIDIRDKKYKGIAVVSDVDTKYSPRMKCYAMANGNMVECKISKSLFCRFPLEEGDVIEIEDTYTKPRQTKGEDGKWVDVPGTKVLWISGYRRIFHQEKKEKTGGKKVG